MLTRLKVSGFKNLVDTEIRFGPLTCIAGANGVGKSNIFDAIRFLSLLADHTFVEAAKKIRGGLDVAKLFTAGGNDEMVFECDIVIPKSGYDDFYQPTEASHTFLEYQLCIGLARDKSGVERFELKNERLTYIAQGKTKKRLGFKPSDAWLDSVIQKSHRRASYIETYDSGNGKRIRLSADKMRDDNKSNRGGGRPTNFLASSLPRTALSAAQNADETRTAVLVRKEMRSWRILQLEPSALRIPDELQAPTTLSVEGRHLPATLYRMKSAEDGDRVLPEISNKLAQLVEDVHTLRVERDEVRRLLHLVLTDTSGRDFSAASLSDGTLRFIALAVLERDPEATGVLCLEEPENGIHPERVGAMMSLLEDMATDISEAVDETNPLRQVIVSTHSPVVVAHVDPNSLVFADHRDDPTAEPGARKSLVIRHVPDTWRETSRGDATVSKGEIAQYLDSIRPDSWYDEKNTIYKSVATQLCLSFEGLK